MAEQEIDKKTVVALLNEILETELAGVVRYTHYSLMIFGHNRIPIVSWLRGEANVCLSHANAAGAGIAGGVIGAIIGGVFALKATKRQVEVMLLQSRGDVNERLYSQSLVIMKFFAENPELRPYFYDNKDLSRAESELQKLKIL